MQKRRGKLLLRWVPGRLVSAERALAGRWGKIRTRRRVGPKGDSDIVVRMETNQASATVMPMVIGTKTALDRPWVPDCLS